jgi:tetratricopeptide (TPR) repeat protein
MKILIKYAVLMAAGLYLSLAPVSHSVAQESIAESYFQAAVGATEQGSYTEAARLARLGLTEVDRQKGSSPGATARQKVRGLNLLSGALIELKSYPEAEKAKREEVALLTGLSPNGYPEYSTNFPMSLESLGFVLTEQAKYEEAEAVYRQALSYREKAYGTDHKAVSVSLINLGDLYLKRDQLTEAEVMSKRALGLLAAALERRELSQDEMFLFMRAAITLARVDVRRKEYARAENSYKFIISSIEQLFGTDDETLAEPLAEYASLLRELKRPGEAARMESRAKRLKGVRR